MMARRRLNKTTLAINVSVNLFFRKFNLILNSIFFLVWGTDAAFKVDESSEKGKFQSLI